MICVSLFRFNANKMLFNVVYISICFLLLLLRNSYFISVFDSLAFSLANGNLDHAFGIVEENDTGTNGRRWKKKPRVLPLISPRTPNSPNAYLPTCKHDSCRPTGVNQLGNGVRHGDYCNGSTPPWECHLVLKLLSPGLLMREISSECRNIILASGSLAPLPSLCAELDLFGKTEPRSTSTSSSSSSSSRRIVASSSAFARPLPPNEEKSTATMFSPPKIKNMMEYIQRANDDKKYVDRLQIQPKPLEANHVVDLQKQLLAVSIGNFSNGEKLTVNYNNYNEQKNPTFFPKLGHSIASIIDGIPRGGCLIFFPSYSFLNKCVACWNPQQYSRFTETAPDVWMRLMRSKGKIIVEPTKSQEEFESARDEYRTTIDTTGCCILLAVFRGKMSEGISFNDDNARAVICVGMPYPNAKDRGITSKKLYNDEQRKLRNKTCLLPGMDFYSQQAHRAIAQALGRCIRHGADYGTVILMDSRHCDDGSPNDGICRAHKNLPKWMRASVRTLSMRPNSGVGHTPIVGGYGGLKKEMQHFFSQAPIAAQKVLDKWKIDKTKAAVATKKKQALQPISGGGNQQIATTATTSTNNTVTVTMNNNNNTNASNKQEKKPIHPFFSIK